jgi:hypothetical protein
MSNIRSDRYDHGTRKGALKTHAKINKSSTANKLNGEFPLRLSLSLLKEKNYDFMYVYYTYTTILYVIIKPRVRHFHVTPFIFIFSFSLRLYIHAELTALRVMTNRQTRNRLSPSTHKPPEKYSQFSVVDPYFWHLRVSAAAAAAT